jgi:hypothetical protein
VLIIICHRASEKIRVLDITYVSICLFQTIDMHPPMKGSETRFFQKNLVSSFHD